MSKQASKPHSDAVPTVKSRRWQFRLRTLVLAMLLACTMLAWIGHRCQSARRQRAAAAVLQLLGARVEHQQGNLMPDDRPRSFYEQIIQMLRDALWPNVKQVWAEGVPLTDADLAVLQDLSQLDGLDLSKTQVTDAGLAYLRHIPRLRSLHLSENAITDSGLAHVASLRKLKWLFLEHTRVTDAGIVHCKAMSDLYLLDLSNTDVGNAGLAHLQGLTHLVHLRLNGTRITDAGLSYLSQLTQMESLDLSGTAIAGRGLSALTGLLRLRWLYLRDSKLDDEGIDNLTRFTSLIVVDIDNTPATDAAVERLRQRFHGLSVDGVSYRDLYEESETWRSSGVRDKTAPNYLLNKWITADYVEPQLSAIPPRLQAALRNDTQDIVDVYSLHLTEDIRDQLSRLRKVRWLRLCTETTAQDLQWIGCLTQLRGLSLRGADLRGADFSTLRNLQSLQWLDVAGADMSAKEFGTLPRLESLETLFLAGGVDDRYVLHLATLQLPLLSNLSLEVASVSDVGIEQLCASYNLEYLHLHQCTGITAKSVDALGRMTNLRFLGIGGTGLSSQVQRLRELLPACSIDGGL